MSTRLALLLLPVLVSCTASTPPTPTWSHQVALDAGVKLGGCAVGDIDPTRPGNEVAVVAGDGGLYVVYPDGDGWGHERIGAATGEMIQCAIGDALPEREGQEVVAVGIKQGTEDDNSPGAAVIFYRDGDSWKIEPFFEDTALLHGVCIGDIDPGHPGDEVLLVGYSLRATLATHDGGAWQTRSIADLTGAGKSAVPFGKGAAIACADGSVVLVEKAGDGWTATNIDQAGDGQSRIGTDGKRLLVARDDGVLSLVTRDGRTEIYQEPDKLRGAVLADLDGRPETVEAATTGYSHWVTVLRQIDGKWTSDAVFEESSGLHHLTAGEFAGRDKGVELVTCGYSGRLTVLFRQ